MGVMMMVGGWWRKSKTRGRRNDGNSNGKMRRDSGDTGMTRAEFCFAAPFRGLGNILPRLVRGYEVLYTYVRR
jgi:hypothetical protein